MAPAARVRQRERGRRGDLTAHGGFVVDVRRNLGTALRWIAHCPGSTSRTAYRSVPAGEPLGGFVAVMAVTVSGGDGRRPVVRQVQVRQLPAPAQGRQAGGGGSDALAAHTMTQAGGAVRFGCFPHPLGGLLLRPREQVQRPG